MRVAFALSCARASYYQVQAANIHDVRAWILTGATAASLSSERIHDITAFCSGRRAPTLPESFLMSNASSSVYQRVPQAVEEETLAKEEFILRKWEVWNAWMAEQLALEGTVPAAVLCCNTPHSDCFHRVSRFSNRSISRVQPKNARGFLSLQNYAANASSLCSSLFHSPRSRLGGEVTTFKVADRLTASAERRRYRSKSTNDSRELLF